MKQHKIRHPRTPIVWMSSPSNKHKPKKHRHRHQDKDKVLTLPIQQLSPAYNQEMRDENGFYILARRKGAVNGDK